MFFTNSYEEEGVEITEEDCWEQRMAINNAIRNWTNNG